MSEEYEFVGALAGRHKAAGAVMAAEASWQVPMSYGGTLDEALAARQRCGVADVSHCGRLRVRGDDALALLGRLCSHDVDHQLDDCAALTVLCNDRGGVIDVCRLLRLEDCWLLLTSPACRLKVLGHLKAQAAGMDVKIDDQTPGTTQLSLVGPAAPQALDALLPFKPSELAAGGVKTGFLMIARYIAVRGDIGTLWSLDVVLPNLAAGLAWDYITRKAGDKAMTPLGLAAMDVLRIEAGLVRYGHEVSEALDPLSAGLADAVDLRRQFIGADALRSVRPSRRRMGLVLKAPQGQPSIQAVPRQGDVVLDADSNEVGAVTSGTWSPALSRPVAQAYLAMHVQAGQAVKVATAGGQVEAEVTALPIVG